jgi:hypothetical protein
MACYNTHKSTSVLRRHALYSGKISYQTLLSETVAKVVPKAGISENSPKTRWLTKKTFNYGEIKNAVRGEKGRKYGR